MIQSSGFRGRASGSLAIPTGGDLRRTTGFVGTDAAVYNGLSKAAPHRVEALRR
jgi:hypothetical protein